METRPFRPGDAVALIAAVVLLAMVALDVEAWVRPPLAVLFAFWVPGAAVASWLPNLTHAEHRGVAITLSLAISILVPTGAIWAHWWHPVLLFDVTAAASVLSLLLAWWRSGAQLPGPPRPPRPSLRARHVPLAAGCTSGVIALVQLAGHDGVAVRWGLLTALPVAWFVAAGATAVAAAMAFRAGATRSLAGSSVLLVVLLHAPAAVAYAVPRFAWTYKHLGVTEYFLANGHASSGVDIYNNWPGFFALTAHLFEIAGLDDVLGLLKWWPAIIGLAAIVVLRFFFGALTDDPRILWGAVALFVVANWFGQDYFAPQSVAFIVAFGTFGLLLRTNSSPERLQFAMGRHERATYGAAATLAFAAAVVTHQLTPYLILPGVVVAALLGGIRPKWLAIVCGALAVAYVAPRFDWVRAHGGLASTSVGDNVRSPAAELAGAAWSVTVSNWASRILTVSLVLGSIPYLVRFRRDRWWTVLLVSNLVGPATVLLVQAYGNEGVLRSALFVTPWMAFATMASLVHRRSYARPARAGAAVAFGAAIACGVALFALATWGLDARYRMYPGEVRLQRAFEADAPDGAVLAQLGPQHLPLRISARYPAFEFTVVAPFADGGSEVGDVLRQLEAAAARVSRRRAVYVASTSGADRFSAVFGYGDPADYAALRAAIERSRRWQVLIANRDELLVRYAG